MSSSEDTKTNSFNFTVVKTVTNDTILTAFQTNLSDFIIKNIQRTPHKKNKMIDNVIVYFEGYLYISSETIDNIRCGRISKTYIKLYYTDTQYWNLYLNILKTQKNKTRQIDNETIIKKYEYELQINDFKINELKTLCDNLFIQLDDKDNAIIEKDRIIDTLKGLLEMSNPELLRVYEGKLSPF